MIRKSFVCRLCYSCRSFRCISVLFSINFASARVVEYVKVYSCVCVVVSPFQSIYRYCDRSRKKRLFSPHFIHRFENTDSNVCQCVSIYSFISSWFYIELYPHLTNVAVAVAVLEIGIFYNFVAQFGFIDSGSFWMGQIGSNQCAELMLKSTNENQTQSNSYGWAVRSATYIVGYVTKWYATSILTLSRIVLIFRGNVFRQGFVGNTNFNN